MFGSAALELAIGLIFIVMLVSLLVTALTELLASWLRWRASNLWKSLRGMLGGSVQEQVYNHPLLKTLMTPTTGPPVGLAWLFRLPGLRRLWPTAKGPSYIPPRTFALALLDLIEQPYQAVSRLIDAIDAAAAEPARIPAVIASAKALAGLPSMATTITRMQPLLDELGEAGIPRDRTRAILLRLRHEATALTQHPALFDADVQAALRPLMVAAGGRDDRVRAEVETWFTEITERSAGWYKRKTQAIQVALGLALAIWIDVDMILISRALWADSTLRSALVAEAEAAAKEPAPVTITTAPLSPQQRIADVRGQMLALGLPLRGSCDAILDASGSPKPLPWWCTDPSRATKTFQLPWFGQVTVAAASLRWCGWFLTAFAVSLGAAFWFDSLKRVMTIRAAGRAPENAADEPKATSEPTQTTK